MLHLEENGTDVAVVYGEANDTLTLFGLEIDRETYKMWIPLSHYRSETKEQTGLTDLVLVCEDKKELRSTPDERVGHVYQSNDADCSNKAKNYIKGVRMQYDKTKYPEYEPTMVANFAIACTQDYKQSMLRESALSFFPKGSPKKLICSHFIRKGCFLGSSKIQNFLIFRLIQKFIVF